MAEKLIRMAGQIADFFRHQPGVETPKAVGTHINAYWTYRMRQDFLDHVATGAEMPEDIRAAAAHVVIPRTGGDPGHDTDTDAEIAPGTANTED